jgi:hypothetical protein
MTTIRLDAATLAQFKAAEGRVLLADETGTPHQVCVVSPVPLDREPELTEDEWDAIENDPAEYTLAEAWEKIRRGEKL